MSTLRIATRASAMAMAQARWVQAALAQYYPQLRTELLPMTTTGDQQLSMPLATIGGKGLFLKELETALLEQQADIAVHSLKDVTVELPEGLVLAAYCERSEARDALVAKQATSFAALSLGAVVGTSSLRRHCLLRALRPDLVIKPLRGNVQTRLAKLARGEYDALVLSAAGLLRLDLQHDIAAYLAVDEFIPAVGQGALTIECRATDQRVLDLMQVLDHAATRACVTAERAFNQALQGGCQVPIAGHASLDDTGLCLRGLVGKPDGSVVLRAEQRDRAEHATALGQRVADELLAQGAGAILRSVYAS